MTPSPRLLLVFVCAAALALTATPARSAEPTGPDTLAPERPSLRVPATAPGDSIEQAPPGPLLVPSAPPPPDTTAQARARRAREFVAAGKAFEAGARPASAIAAYRSAVLLDESVPDAYHRMGVLFAAVGEDKQAIACLSAELGNHPSNTAAGRMLGVVLARNGDTTRAIRQLELLVRRDPNDSASWAALGFAYTAASRLKDAETALRRALRIDPRCPDAERDLGALLASQKRTDEARAAFARAARAAPRDPSVPFNLGNLERRLKRAEPALEAYRHAEALDSTFAFALQGQAQVLIETGREREAGEVYRRWLRVRPDDHNARLDAIRLHERIGRRDVALELARNGVRGEPRSSDAHLMYGMALSSAGLTREALVELRRADALAAGAAERGRAAALIAALRREAPDSLRALFDADSLAHPQPAPTPTPARPRAPGGR